VLSHAREIQRLRAWAASNCCMAATPESERPGAETDGAASRCARLVDLGQAWELFSE
jgi:hypothetical protein